MTIRYFDATEFLFLLDFLFPFAFLIRLEKLSNLLILYEKLRFIERINS